MEQYTKNSIELAYFKLEGKPGPLFLWGHGWGQTHKSFLPLLESLKNFGTHIAFDFPGFGESSLPEDDFGTAEYADLIAAFIEEKKIGPVIWVGHSFGGRVGLQLASRHPQCITTIIHIAGAGLPRKRKLLTKVKVFTYKFLKRVGFSSEILSKKFGSSDYQNAGKLRPVFIKVVNEDLTEQASKVECPALLIYGENDTETPPEIGIRLEKIISNTKLIILEGQDHYSVLGEGKHKVAAIISKHLKEVL